jgi:arylsulfatase A-like enzyme/tetratricopeptide (TPR) repeat protein
MRYARVLLAALLLVCGCARENQVNVLLITIDTARADRFSCYGYPEPSSPNIDQLAAEGALFTQTFCTNPITLPSHTSIMTGTYPIFHGVRDNSIYVVRDEVTTLAEVLGDAGYDTGAVIGAFVLDSRFNLDQGFATYEDRLAEGWSKDEMAMRAANAFGFAERKANLVTVAALKWLRQPRSKPFFLWLHYFDPHQPVNPPEPHHSRFSEPYVGEIGYTDEQLSSVLDELKRQGEYDRTMIVVTSDHGEGLMEHGEPTHSLLLFDSVMRVPLIFRVPGEPAGLQVDQLSGTVDIMPTILDLLELEIPADVQGRSLAALVRGDAVTSAPRSLYMESLVATLQCGWGTLRALRTSDEKLIHGPKPRFYRVDEDPGEIHDLAARDPDAVERLTADLDRAMKRWTSEEATSSQSSPDEETLRKLATLGYISRASHGLSGISSSLDDVQGMDDPHEMRWLFDVIGVATENLRTGYELEGIRQLQQVLTADPDNPSALTCLGKAYMLLGTQPNLARDYFERSLAVDPDQEEALYFMCRIHRAAGELDEAQRCAERILEFQPLALAALQEMASILETRGDPVRAREYLHKLIDVDESNVGALLALGLSHGRQKEHEEAGVYIKRALDLEPENAMVLYNVGVWHLQGGDIEEAIATLSRTVLINPMHPDAYFVLGRLLYEQNETERAREALIKARGLARRGDRQQMIDDMLQHIDSG